MDAGENNLWLPNIMDFETIKIYFLLRLDTGTVTVMKQCYISIKKKKDGRRIHSFFQCLNLWNQISQSTYYHLFFTQKTLTDDLLCERHKLPEIECESKTLCTNWFMLYILTGTGQSFCNSYHVQLLNFLCFHFSTFNF